MDIDAALKALEDLGGPELANGLGEVFHQMEWAADEIEAAQQRHPEMSERLDQAFILIRSTDPLMRTEFVYRSHAREILERIAAGQDTRPGTAAEAACICSRTSLEAPLTGAGFGLYGRVWAQAFPDQPQPMADEQGHYERIHGSEIDRLEAGIRRKAAQEWRRLEKPAKRPRKGAVA